MKNSFLSVASLFLAVGCNGFAQSAKASIEPINMAGILRTATTATTASLPPGVTVPVTAVVTKNVQTLSGWQICVASCANGAVPKSYKMTQHVASASQNNDGTGATLHQSGTPFGDVMWHDTIAQNSSATHFVMDMYIKVDHPENVQALEIALLKRIGSYWYKASTQCNYKTGDFRGYSPGHGWVSLGAKCVKAQANTWQRVTLQFSVSSGRTSFDGASFNGVLQPMAATLAPVHESTTSQTMGVHFQLDNANTTSGYTVDVDNWNVYSW